MDLFHDTKPTPMPVSRNAGAGIVVFTRILPWLALLAAEQWTLNELFEVERGLVGLEDPLQALRHFAMWGTIAALLFVILVWPTRTRLTEALLDCSKGRSLRTPLAAHVTAVLLSGGLAVLITSLAITHGPPPRWVLLLYCVPLLAVAVSMLWLIAPFAYWRAVLRDHAMEAWIAAVTAVPILTLAVQSRNQWDALSSATLRLTLAFLTLLGVAPSYDIDAKRIAVGDFEVLIGAPCSGYEGIGLVTAFMTFYLWTFRERLRFPRAFILIPLGMLVIWVLNAVRLAILILIGAYLSPQVAMGGFHSQAGWFTFLLVSGAIMLAIPHIPSFSRHHAPDPPATPEHDRLMLAHVGPFVALMLASVIVAGAAPFDHDLYGLKVVGVAACLWLWRSELAALCGPVSPLSVLAGAIVGLIWLATTAPTVTAVPEPTSLTAFLAAQTPAMAALWLAIRGLGAIITVPIAEELAFRGLLYRWLIDRRFEAVPFDRLAWVPLLASSLLFGVLHQRWAAGALAGVVFALVMIRTGRLRDAIAAHMIANATIFAWAVARQQWHHL